MFKVITGTLQANHNTIQLTDATITNDSIFEVYADTENVIPSSVSVGGHTVTVTFDSKPSNNVGIKVLINNIVGEFAPDTIDAENVTYLNDSIGVNNSKDALDSLVTMNTVTLQALGTLNTEIEERIPTNTVLGGVLYHSTTGNEWKKLSGANVNYDDDTTINEKLDEVFQSVSNGKTLIADAITDKGVETSASDTFSTMAENIANIPSGGNSDLFGFEFKNSGTGISGFYSASHFINDINFNFTLTNVSGFEGFTIPYRIKQTETESTYKISCNVIHSSNRTTTAQYVNYWGIASSDTDIVNINITDELARFPEKSISGSVETEVTIPSGNEILRKFLVFSLGGTGSGSGMWQITNLKIEKVV